MTKAEMNREVKSFLSRMHKVLIKKNNDYVGDKDALNNFKIVSVLGVCTPAQGILARMTDKMSRVATLTSGTKSKVKDERIEDTLMDLANYAVLLNCIIKEGATSVKSTLFEKWVSGMKRGPLRRLRDILTKMIGDEEED